MREALKGHRVARLKGGDPLIFGRAAEEIAVVRAAGLEVEIIPGITAAHACAASVGLPLTLRGKVRHLSIVTGTSETGEPELDWQSLAASGQALAIYMGLANVRQIEAELRHSGMPDNTPVVVVENGTRANERAIATTLAELSAAVAAERIQAPAIIFVGVSWQDAHLTPPARVKTFAPAHRHRKRIDGFRELRVEEARVTALLPKSAPFAPDEIEALNRVVGPSTPLQRSWLTGFLAGLEAAGQSHAVAPAAAPRARTPLMLLYGSELGNAESLALKARKLAQRHGFDARVVDMADANLSGLAKAGNVVVLLRRGAKASRRSAQRRSTTADE